MTSARSFDSARSPEQHAAVVHVHLGAEAAAMSRQRQAERAAAAMAADGPMKMVLASRQSCNSRARSAFIDGFSAFIAMITEDGPQVKSVVWP